ncbi:peptidoglycan-binding protein [Nocardia sp. NPDC050408]|uniref:peptidoglycan-binding protein n=1 Tax=Nocardia sp. NPDC050408 TaxID=3364319 RepID=UPI0037AC0518
MGPGDKGISVRRIQWAMIDLEFDLPMFGADGSFGEETVSAVSAYKRSRGIEPSDGKVGVKTMTRLDTEPLHSLDDQQLHYSDRKSFYTNRALAKANDAAHIEWEPTLGWAANRPRIIDLYGYYRDLYVAAPLEFLWAGLGRMAGGTIVGGLDADPGFIEQSIMVRIGRDIFFDLAWMHEAFLDHPTEAIKLGHLHDRFAEYTAYLGGVPQFLRGFPTRSYGAAWNKITTGLVAEGNQDLLENEQRTVIQPHYDVLRTMLFAGLPTPFTNNVHPYHRAFIVDLPGADILLFEDRWQWITFPNGMFQRWGDIGADERLRLATLAMDDIIAARFGGPGRPDLLPPGGP